MAASKKPRFHGDEPMDIITTIRLTKKDREKLEYLAKEFNMSKAEILRRGLDIQYNMVTYG